MREIQVIGTDGRVMTFSVSVNATAQDVECIIAGLDAQSEDPDDCKCDKCGSQMNVIAGDSEDTFINLCEKCHEKEADALSGVLPPHFSSAAAAEIEDKVEIEIKFHEDFDTNDILDLASSAPMGKGSREQVGAAVDVALMVMLYSVVQRLTK
jgi:hypothetical protein